MRANKLSVNTTKKEAQHDVEFAEGGNTKMFGQQSAETDVPGNTGKTPKAAPGAKYASGGSTKMFGFSPSVPQQGGRTSAR
jgi:hypothetical protein